MLVLSMSGLYLLKYCIVCATLIWLYSIVLLIWQLDYKVTKSKVEEIFRIAGNVIEIELKTDKDGRSRGMCTVRYEHPMEAVQAIGILYDDDDDDDDDDYDYDYDVFCDHEHQ